MYKAIEDFYDLKDKNHKYQPGDAFPRAGLTVSAERIEELSTANNRRGIALIQEVKPTRKAKRDAD